MSEIRAQIEARLKTARVERDDRTKNVIGMLKAKVLNELKAGTGTEETDQLWRDTLASYAKQVKKAIAEFEKLGDRAAEALDEARFELAFCLSFLPAKLDEAQTEALVRQAAATHGLKGAKLQGKLVGLLMKEHREELDADLAKTIATRVLTELEST